MRRAASKTSGGWWSIVSAGRIINCYQCLCCCRRVIGVSTGNFLSSSVDAPSVTLKMGPNLNANDIKEGDDVYFECHIHANPKPYKMAWFHNVSPSPPPLPRSLIGTHNRLSSTATADSQSLLVNAVPRMSWTIPPIVVIIKNSVLVTPPQAPLHAPPTYAWSSPWVIVL